LLVAVKGTRVISRLRKRRVLPRDFVVVVRVVGVCWLVVGTFVVSRGTLGISNGWNHGSWVIVIIIVKAVVGRCLVVVGVIVGVARGNAIHVAARREVGVGVRVGVRFCQVSLWGGVIVVVRRVGVLGGSVGIIVFVVVVVMGGV